MDGDFTRLIWRIWARAPRFAQTPPEVAQPKRFTTPAVRLAAEAGRGLKPARQPDRARPWMASLDQTLKYGSCVRSGTAGGRNSACAARERVKQAQLHSALSLWFFSCLRFIIALAVQPALPDGSKPGHLADAAD